MFFRPIFDAVIYLDLVIGIPKNQMYLLFFESQIVFRSLVVTGSHRNNKTNCGLGLKFCNCQFDMVDLRRVKAFYTGKSNKEQNKIIGVFFFFFQINY